MLTDLILGYLAVGVVIMYVNLNGRNLETFPAFFALLIMITFWLPIIIKLAYEEYRKRK